MEKVITCEDTSLTNENTVIINNDKSLLINSVITFNGKNNILIIEDGVKLSNSKITFNGEHSVVYISKSKHSCNLNITVYNESVVYLGCDSYYNGTLNIIASERQNVIIGNDCLFSFGIWIRTADPHLIYSTLNKKRLNNSKSVFIGDHVWIGQSAMILKGCEFGSGSILGGGSVASGKKIPSNTSYAGNPAKLISENIFYTNSCVHAYDETKTNESQVMNTDEWIYSQSSDTLIMSDLDLKLKHNKSADSKLSIIKKYISDNNSKNRFFVPETKSKRSFFKK